MDQVRVGVIGVGTMGQRHCRVYANLRRVQLVGVCDASAEVGRRVAEQYEAKYFDQIDDLLDQVDAVSLVTPTPLHFDLAMRCLKKGVHVLVEKPITETVAQAEELTKMAEESGLIVQVGHIERFNPGYIELKNVLEDRTMLAINLRRLSAFEGSNTDVDVVLDLMVHDLDLILNLVGQWPTTISAHGLTAFSGVVDHAIATLCFENGPVVNVTASRVTEQKVRSFEVTCADAYLEADLLNKTISVHRRTFGENLSHNHRGAKYRQESVVERIHVATFEPLFLELQHFVESLLENRPSRVPARDGLEALRLATLVRDTIHSQLVKIDAMGGLKSRKPEVGEPALVLARN